MYIRKEIHVYKFPLYKIPGIIRSRVFHNQVNSFFSFQLQNVLYAADTPSHLCSLYNFNPLHCFYHLRLKVSAVQLFIKCLGSARSLIWRVVLWS